MEAMSEDELSISINFGEPSAMTDFLIKMLKYFADHWDCQVTIHSGLHTLNKLRIIFTDGRFLVYQ